MQMPSVYTITHTLPVNRETARRWRRRRRIPPVPEIALRLRIEGDLGLISPAWAGFRLQGDKLTTPEGIAWTAGTLLAWHYERQQLADLKQKWEHSRQLPLV